MEEYLLGAPAEQAGFCPSGWYKVVVQTVGSANATTLPLGLRFSVPCIKCLNRDVVKNRLIKDKHKS